MNISKIVKKYYGYSFPVYDLNDGFDQEIQIFCLKIISSGAWVSHHDVLAQLVVDNAWDPSVPIHYEDEASSYPLYLGCSSYIWDLMPDVYRKYIIDRTGEEHFHLIAHNFFHFNSPAEWLNDHVDLALSIGTAVMDEIYAGVPVDGTKE